MVRFDFNLPQLIEEDILYIPDGDEYMIPNEIIHISYSTLFHGYSIKILHIPASVASISEMAFFNCPNLKSINIISSPYFCSKAGILYDKNYRRLIKFPDNKKIEHFIINESVKILDKNAIRGCVHLKRVDIHTNVTTIDVGNFEYCPNLKTIKFYHNNPYLINFNGHIIPDDIYRKILVPNSCYDLYKNHPSFKDIRHIETFEK